MTQTLRYRQKVADFRARLNAILAGAGPRSGRIQIDTTGNRTGVVPFSNTEQQMVLYGQRRHESAARILALFEIARGYLRQNLQNQRLQVRHTHARWQAFRGTKTHNACHTCPAHLKINGRHPTQITGNRGLQRYLIIEFSDCMLMPRSINNVDSAVDDVLGRNAFANAVEKVLNEPDATWRDGLRLYRETMREALGSAAELFSRPLESGFQPADAGVQQQLDMLSAYYEGLFLHSENKIQIDNFVHQVNQEMGLP
jgi:hypothetical protein